MRNNTIGAVSAALLSLTVSAQTRPPEPAQKVNGPVAESWLGTGLFTGVTEVAQIELRKIPGLSANQYYCLVTAKFSGSAGGWDIASGIADVAAKTFTRNSDVNALNVSGDEFAGTISSDGLFYVADTPTGAKYAIRTSTTAAFTAWAGNITGAGSGYIDPKIAYRNGQEYLSYVSGTDIFAGRVSRTGAVTGGNRIITNPTGSAGLHSQQGVENKAGNTVAWIHSARPTGFASNPNWFPAWDDSLGELTVEFHSDTNWDANPGTDNSGTSWWASATSGYQEPIRFGLAAMASTEIKSTGGAINNTFFVPSDDATKPYACAMIIGVKAMNPLQLPNVNGKVAMDLTQSVVLPSLAVAPGGKSQSYNIPVAGAPANARVDAQGVVVDLLGNKIYMTNEASIYIVP